MSSINPDKIREGEIRANLDKLFSVEGLGNYFERLERLSGGPKTFARQASSVLTEFWEEEGVFVVLHQDQDERLSIRAYADGETQIRENGEWWSHYQDIVFNSEEADLSDLPELGKSMELPSPLDDERYAIDTPQEYSKLRDGVIGPYTEEYHDEYGDFEMRPINLDAEDVSR